MKAKPLIEIYLSKLIIPDDRKDETEDSLELLNMSITSSGLIEPISVVGPYKHGDYRVVSGVRRLNAMRLSSDGDITVPCYVLGSASTPEATIERLRVESHLTVRKTDEKAARLVYCELLAREYGIDAAYVKRLKYAFGCSDRYCRQFRDVMVNGTDILKQSLYRDECSLRVGEAAIIANAAPGNAKAQEELLESHFEKRKLKKQLCSHLPCASGAAACFPDAPAKGPAPSVSAGPVPPMPETPVSDPAAEELILQMERFCESHPSVSGEDMGKILSLCARIVAICGEVRA